MYLYGNTEINCCCCCCDGLYWFHKNTVNHFFFHCVKKIVANADAWVCFFSRNVIKVFRSLLEIFRLLLKTNSSMVFGNNTDF